MSVRSKKPNRKGEAPAEPERDGIEIPIRDVKARRQRDVVVFVPPGTFDNSLPFERWETRRHNIKSPDRDERAHSSPPNTPSPPPQAAPTNLPASCFLSRIRANVENAENPKSKRSVINVQKVSKRKGK
jgi:hypothetical protein